MDTKKHAATAANHAATLNAFAAVMALLEGGTVWSATAHKSQGQIIRICKAEMQRQVKLHDKAIAKAAAKGGGQ